MNKAYTHEDMKKELLKTKRMKKLYEKELNLILVAHQIAELREKHHMSQKQLADKLHTHQQVVSRLEKDTYKPSLSTLEKIAGIFGKRLQIRFI